MLHLTGIMISGLGNLRKIGGSPGIDNAQGLTGLYADNSRMKPAAPLIDRNGLNGRWELLPFKAALDVDEGIDEIVSAIYND
jgi:hypothetical protein